MKFVSALFALVLVGCSAPASEGKTAQLQANDSAPPARVGKQGPVGEVSLTNDSSRDLSARTFSFGQIFRRGEVAVGEAVQVTVGGQPLPTQIDAKALNADGSVRHAVVTVELPEMPGKAKLKATLVNNLKGPTAAPAGMVPAPDLQVTLALAQDAKPKRIVNLDLASIVAAEARNKPDFWLNGPLTQERRYAVDVDRRLQVVFDVYTPRTGPTRVDVIFRNDWNDLKVEQDYAVYDVKISMGGKSVFSERNVRQYPFSTWHYLAWSDGAAAPRTTPKLADLIAAGAVPRYDEKFQIGKERGQVTDLARTITTEPLGSGSVTTYMPTTGGRFDIGPLPTWTVIDLLDGDAASRRLLLENADVAGSIPWHIRERTTALPLTTDKYPGLWLDGRATEFAPLAGPFEGDESTGWTIDPAHQPSLTYVPYLITGLRYYKDELAQQAAYVLLSFNNGYRGGAAALIDGQAPEPWWEQRRGIAWSLRTLANAAYAMPNDDPLHGYFDAKLRGNLADMVNKYVVGGRYKDAGPVEGWVPPADVVSPWQQGFFSVTLGWINDMGYSDAGRLLGWTSNFLTGLFTSEGDGFDPDDAVSSLKVMTEGDDPKPLSSWKAVTKVSGVLDDTASERAKRREESWGYYGLIMRAALASAYSVKPDERTKKAYDYVSKRIGMEARGGDPTFAIVPR